MSRLFEEDFFFKASVERVWQALTTPEGNGEVAGLQGARFEPRVGGSVHLEGLHPGELTAFEPPHTFTWAWDPDDGSEPVVETLTLEAVEGGTRIRFGVERDGRPLQAEVVLAPRTWFAAVSMAYKEGCPAEDGGAALYCS